MIINFGRSSIHFMVIILILITCQRTNGSSIDKANTFVSYNKQEPIKTKESTNINKLGKEQKLNLQILQSMYWMHDNQYNLNPTVDQKNFLMENIRPIFKPLIISGSGATLYTNENKDIIDFSSMNVNCILGQNDVWVKLNQAAYILSNKPSFHSRRFGSEAYYKIPKLLADAKIGGISDPLINHKQSNGSDVVELAINAAFSKKGKRKYIVSFLGSYHGQNFTSCVISDKKKEHKFLNSSGNKVIFLDSPPNEMTWIVPEVLEERELSYEEKKIVRKLESIAKNTYVIILEPIQGNNGLRMFSLPLIKKIKEISVKYDICLIFDEIQTGFGWLGKMTAAELYGISPDILLLSKGLTAGNGPLSIAIFSGKYKKSVTDGTSEKTNGGDLRSLVAVKAVFERLNGVSNPEDIPNSLDKNMRRELKDGLLIGYNKKVRFIEDRLTKLMHNHKRIISKKVGMGLIMGFQVKPMGNLSSVEVAQKIIDIGLLNGVALGRSHDVVMIRPPLIISDSELNIGFHRLSKALNSIVSSKSNL